MTSKRLEPRLRPRNNLRPRSAWREAARQRGLSGIPHEQNPSIQPTVPLNARKRVEAQTPLDRIGKPQDIAGMAVFLATNDSSWITGETFLISGGYR
jgi:NAD(P)-dependent dehydrogenase (short-subunit alcohol dehydrogenase family)